MIHYTKTTYKLDKVNKRKKTNNGPSIEHVSNKYYVKYCRQKGIKYHYGDDGLPTMGCEPTLRYKKWVHLAGDIIMPKHFVSNSMCLKPGCKNSQQRDNFKMMSKGRKHRYCKVHTCRKFGCEKIRGHGKYSSHNTPI